MPLFIYHFIVIKSSIWCGLFSCMISCFHGNWDFSTIHSLKCLHRISWLTHETKVAFCKLTCSETYKEKAAKYYLVVYFFEICFCFYDSFSWYAALLEQHNFVLLEKQTPWLNLAKVIILVVGLPSTVLNTQWLREKKIDYDISIKWMQQTGFE